MLQRSEGEISGARKDTYSNKCKVCFSIKVLILVMCSLEMFSNSFLTLFLSFRVDAGLLVVKHCLKELLPKLLTWKCAHCGVLFQKKYAKPQFSCKVNYLLYFTDGFIFHSYSVQFFWIRASFQRIYWLLQLE